MEGEPEALQVTAGFLWGRLIGFRDSSNFRKRAPRGRWKDLPCGWKYSWLCVEGLLPTPAAPCAMMRT